jgi:FlaA1/EpsC-like NDP-sugar epimerase
MASDFRRDVLMTMARVLDLAAMCVSFLTSFAISSGSFTWPYLAHLLMVRVKVANLLLFVAYLALCSAIFSACGLYRSHRLSRWKQRLYEKLLAATLITGVFLVLKHLFLINFAVTEFFLCFWLLTFCALLLSHEIALRLLHLARLRGRNIRNVVIVGEGPAVTALAEQVRQEATLGYRILRIIDAGEIANDGRVAGDS